MQKLIILFIAISSSLGTYAQQALNSYFMYNNYLRTEQNPSLTTINGFLALPGIGDLSVSASSNSYTIDNILYPNPTGSGLVTFLDPNVDATRLLKNIKKDNRLSVNVTVNILAAGFYLKNNFITISAKTKANIQSSLPDQLFRFAKIGPGADGEIYHMDNIHVRASSYAEIALGISTPINDKIRIGVKGKLLAGLANYKVSYNTLDAEFNSNHWKIKSTGTMQIAANEVKTKPRYDEENQPYISYGDFNLSPSAPAGYGVGFDAGVTYQPIHPLNLSFALVNFGKLWWQDKNTINADAVSEYLYDGAFEIINDEVIQKDMADQNLEQLIRFTERDEQKGFVETIYPTINVGAEYNLLRGKISLGMLSSTTIGPYYNNTQLMAMATFRPLTWFTGALSYALINNKFESFGFSLNFHPSWINFIIGSDYFGTSITPQCAPVNSRNAGIYVGMGIPLNSKRKHKQKFFEQ